MRWGGWVEEGGEEEGGDGGGGWTRKWVGSRRVQEEECRGGLMKRKVSVTVGHERAGTSLRHTVDSARC